MTCFKSSQGSQISPLWLAQTRLKRGRFDECSELCDGLLRKNRHDMAAWFLKLRAMTLKNWIEDLEDETEGDALLEDTKVTRNARVGTSFARPLTSTQRSGGVSRRGYSRSGRPTTSARPGTGTRRPTTASVVRASTASVRAKASEDAFLTMSETDIHEFAKNQALTKLLCDFYLYHEHHPQKALDLCLAVSHLEESEDWWWIARRGKCCFQLSMLQDSENQLKRSLELQPMTNTLLDLAKIHIKQDQPNGALALYSSSNEVDCLIGKARIFELLNNVEGSIEAFKGVLEMDQSNVEALASLAAHAFNSGDHQVALSYYRRILQMGVYSVEVWNNLGLCCLKTGRFELALQCFNQALKKVKDSTAADVWYNIGHLGVALGDLEVAEQAFSVAVFMDSSHSESLNNLGVLKSRVNHSMDYFIKSRNACEVLFEPWFNGSLEAIKQGELQNAFTLVSRALDILPEHKSSKSILNKLQNQF